MHFYQDVLASKLSIFIMSNDSNLVCVRIGICILIFDLFFSAHYEGLFKKYLCIYKKLHSM